MWQAKFFAAISFSAKNCYNVISPIRVDPISRQCSYYYCFHQNVLLFVDECYFFFVRTSAIIASIDFTVFLLSRQINLNDVNTFLFKKLLLLFTGIMMMFQKAFLLSHPRPMSLINYWLIGEKQKQSKNRNNFSNESMGKILDWQNYRL